MGKVFVVGIGPGSAEYMTAQARAALEGADVLCGYHVYLELVKPLFPEKETYITSMRQERQRCLWALERAAGGDTVAMVCSGDAGVYGMAGLLMELGDLFPQVELEVVPGVTAALSGAAVLGAPLGHDFCVISLSDLLTSWEVIEQRLRCAAWGEFALCIYNPSSQKRAGYLRRACDILLDAGKDGKTVCGWVRNIGRQGQESRLLTLEELREEQLDMFTTVFIGAESTKYCSGRMVTPRGYRGC
ncbi:precorrin-3B C(17)-methyltransferase [Anaerotignum lactatifermentans]|uniref:Precorrin-3B C(17)-methyltransferase n=1 Tax=Anaerotignum lactatifermentans TaxID=160404 RepID=A0ABS2G9X3_9FIRM|nr:precorrin-3B C(17)-methyltransferase [Anaerotignum lactatifermentans]MBM6829801.1 precorrin-3B C(17)-methyltransferase [Anaerotignum lactatifermentans]MBM6878259.1 precorrin-3B C(17)-methyltransferase [Anaerotignum lactatifermentans]MBM6951339.1 precorrin-3B C(17)-methyltransferase [Anaerotignum lactatifermentans]